MADDTATILTFLLDETGSMQSIKDDTIGGFNAYVESLKADQRPLEFSLLKFDSNHVEKVYVGVPIADVQPLTPDSYRPGAMTPLIDATYKAIEATDAALSARADAPHILVVVQTDGQENCSTEHSRTELAQLVKEKTTKGWGFVFLGAGIDAFAEAGGLGFSAQNTLSYGRRNTQQTFGAMAVNTASYRGGGGAMSLAWSDTQRTDAGDQYAPVSPTSAPAPSMPTPASAGTPRTRTPIVDEIDLTTKE